jgi:hypothetical protein
MKKKIFYVVLLLVAVLYADQRFGNFAATGNGSIAGTLGLTGQLQSGGGSQSTPAYSFSAETNSGWFRQQAGIMGFAIGGNYITQYSAGRIGNAPGVCMGWAPGAPNSNTDDTRLCRTSASLLTLDNGAAGAATFKVATLQATASATTPSLAINSDTAMTAAPRMTWVGFQPGNISAATISRFTPDKSITITSIEAVATVISSCTVAPTITITGTTTSTLTLPSGSQWTTGAIANNYTGGSTMIMIAGTTGTCTTPPANLNIIVQYKMQ